MTPARILVLCSGGREHALAWRLARDTHRPEVLVARGNDGMARDFERLAVRDSDRAPNAQIGPLVVGLPDVRVRVSGFADARGDEAQNIKLSQERAAMFANELEKAGVPKERLIIEAMGERFAASEAATDDQAFERCVEIRLEKGAALASN